MNGYKLLALLTNVVSAPRFAVFTTTAIVMATATPALAQTSTQSPWRYKANYGMTSCEFEGFTSTTAAVNGGPVQTGPRSITMNAEAGHSVDLYLYCARSQTWDGAGQLVIGPEVSYSSSAGGGAVVGYDRPSDPVTSDVQRPKGRKWTVPASPATYTLTGGSDTLTVTVNALAPPVSQEQFAPVEAAVEEFTTESWMRRKVQFGVGYAHGLDEYPFKEHSRNGATFFFEGYPVGSNDGAWKLSLGAHATWQSRFKPVVTPPGLDFNVQPNGYFADWSSTYLAASVGANFQPVKFFSMNLRGLLGPMIFVDGNVPISQLASSKDVIFGKGKTDVALAAGLGLDMGFHIGMVRLSTGFELIQTLTSVETNRLPEYATCTTATINVACLQAQKGHIFDANWNILAVGVQIQ